MLSRVAVLKLGMPSNAFRVGCLCKLRIRLAKYACYLMGKQKALIFLQAVTSLALCTKCTREPRKEGIPSLKVFMSSN